MATIVTSLAATRSGILASARSSRAPARPSPPARNTPLPRDPNGSHARLRWRACKAPLDCRRATTRPVSSYALFQWWLLLSQHPGCLGRRTSFPTQHALRDLSRRSGLFPSRRRSLAPAVSLPRRKATGIRGLAGCGKLAPPNPASALPPAASLSPAVPGTREAAPLCISGRTSYLLVRLAFHPYPQVIPMLCNARGSGPSRRVTAAAPCPWVAHQVSGQRRPTLPPSSDSPSLRLRRACALASPAGVTRRIMLQKARHQAGPRLAATATAL